MTWLALFRYLLRLESEAGGEDDERSPEDVGAEQVDGLKPHRGKKDNVENAKHVLKGKKDEDRGGEAAVVPMR